MSRRGESPLGSKGHLSRAVIQVEAILKTFFILLTLDPSAHNIEILVSIAVSIEKETPHVLKISIVRKRHWFEPLLAVTKNDQAPGSALSLAQIKIVHTIAIDITPGLPRTELRKLVGEERLPGKVIVTLLGMFYSRKRRQGLKDRFRSNDWWSRTGSPAFNNMVMSSSIEIPDCLG